MTDSSRILFHAEINKLIADPNRDNFFRVDHNTVAVSDGSLSKRILAARPLHDFERTVFKPIAGRPIRKDISTAVMRAVNLDIRDALARDDLQTMPMTGIWPRDGHRFLQRLLYGGDPWNIRLLSHWSLQKSDALNRLLDFVVGRQTWRAAGNRESALAGVLRAIAAHDEKRIAVALYRRAASAVCSTVSVLITHALWLGSPFDGGTNIRNAILETLRLLPPAWMYLRTAGSEYHALDARIGDGDDILLIPFLTHRDPNVWENAESFVPERWWGIDEPEALDSYLPFGHADDRCWARKIMLLFSERILEEVVRRNLHRDPAQRVVRIPKGQLLAIDKLRVIGGRPV